MLAGNRDERVSSSGCGLRREGGRNKVVQRDLHILCLLKNPSARLVGGTRVLTANVEASHQVVDWPVKIRPLTSRVASAEFQRNPRVAPREGQGLGGATFVPMVETADLRDRHDRAECRWCDGSVIGRVFIEGQMGPRSVVVLDVLSQDTTESRRVHDRHVIEAPASHLANQSLHGLVLPRRTRGGELNALPSRLIRIGRTRCPDRE